MPSSTFNGVEIAYDDRGSGPPLILVHGSWTDRRSWDLVVPALEARFRVVTYDRRGHSESQRPSGQGSVLEDVADLAAIIETLDLAPVHIVANSFGASISLRLAAERPDLIRSLSAHEPPLFGLLTHDPSYEPIGAAAAGLLQAVASALDSGDMEGGARLFVDTALGAGAWDDLPPGDRETFVANADTFLDESRDPEALTLDAALLARFAQPALLSVGSASPPLFPPIITRLASTIASARQHTFEGAGHVPHKTHPDQFVAVTSAFIEANAS